MTSLLLAVLAVPLGIPFPQPQDPVTTPPGFAEPAPGADDFGEEAMWIEFTAIDFARVFDLDGDGLVGRHEAAAAAMQIALEIEELGSTTEAFGERLADRAAERFEWMDLLFEELDADESGLIETDELEDEMLDLLDE